MKLFLVTFICYLIGSFPTAYLLSRIRFHKDIRGLGSGNVGTINFLRVTGSKLYSIIVLLVDISKGYAAIALAAEFLSVHLLIFPALAVIVGHIFPPWLKFKGGRGMATLAGVFLFIEPFAVAVWWLIFILFYFFSKRMIFAGISALFLVNIFIAIVWKLPVFLISSPTSILVTLKYIARLGEEFSNN